MYVLCIFYLERAEWPESVGRGSASGEDPPTAHRLHSTAHHSAHGQRRSPLSAEHQLVSTTSELGRL